MDIMSNLLPDLHAMLEPKEVTWYAVLEPFGSGMVQLPINPPTHVPLPLSHIFSGIHSASTITGMLSVIMPGNTCIGCGLEVLAGQ